MGDLRSPAELEVTPLGAAVVDPAVQRMLAAYSQGIFPMGDPDTGRIQWVLPRERAILPLDERFHVPRRLARTWRRGDFEVRIDTAFAEVVAGCADRPETWILPPLDRWYRELHRAGYAHSVEIWRDGRLVGGLFGIAIGGFFAAESKFHRERDASKLALLALVERLRNRGFELLDVQFYNPHLEQFGLELVPAPLYARRLAAAIRKPVRF